MKKVIVSLALGASDCSPPPHRRLRSPTALRLFRTTVSKTSAWSVTNMDAAGGNAVHVALSFVIRTTTPRANATSTGVDTMTEDTTMMGRASESALVRAA